MEKLTPKSFMMHLLNGSALGIVVALVPGALLGELFKALTPYCEPLGMLTQMIGATNAMVGIAVGVAIGYMFKFTPIESISVGLATMAAGGAVRFADGIIQLKGTGDIFTMVFTAGIAVGLIVLLRGKVRGGGRVGAAGVSVFHRLFAAAGLVDCPPAHAGANADGGVDCHRVCLPDCVAGVIRGYCHGDSFGWRGLGCSQFGHLRLCVFAGRGRAAGEPVGHLRGAFCGFAQAFHAQYRG